MSCNCHKRARGNCIQAVPIFSSLTEEEMLEVARVTNEKTFIKGEMVYIAGDRGEKLYVIHSGKVKVTRLSDTGKEQVIRIVGPGDFIGELSLFSSDILIDNCEAIEDTILCQIDGQKIKNIMVKYPTIAFKLLEELSRRLSKTEDLLEKISLHGAERRLATELIKLSDESGRVELKMSKKDFASSIGMSQETLSRKLSYFQDEGMIKLIGHRKIVLLDIDAMKSI